MPNSRRRRSKRRRPKLAESKLNLGYTRVVAPIAGLSSRAPKSEGSLVTANETLLTTISQSNPIMDSLLHLRERTAVAQSTPSARAASRCRRTTAYDVVGASWPTARSSRAAAASISADTRVNPSTGSVTKCAPDRQRRQRAETGPVRAGSRLSGAVRNNALTVPQIAVLDGAQGKFVYVADRDKDGGTSPRFARSRWATG